MLDLEYVRAQFPALDSPWTLMDNAGGSAPCRQVIERVADHMARIPVQLGGSYEQSVAAGEAVRQGRAAVATLMGAAPDEIVLGPSSTVLAQRLARALRPLWKEGDEVVVTNLDHETNIGPWRRLAETGIVVREWKFRPATAALHVEDLEPLLGKRTRLVAFTHCPNVVGSVHDVATIAARVRAAGALSCVDGVAYAPHRRVDVRALGVDFYLASLYKVYGPHVSMLFGRRELLLEARSANHFFFADTDVPGKLEPGNVNYELTASLVGILDYFTAFGRHHGLRHDLGENRGEDLDLEGCFRLVAAHETELVRPLLGFLDEHPRVHIVGSPVADAATRVPTVAFTVDGRRAGELPPLLDERRIAIRFGHFYAHRAIEALGLHEREGVVRVSLVHYNTPDEVEKLIEALSAVL